MKYNLKTFPETNCPLDYINWKNKAVRELTRRLRSNKKLEKEIGKDAHIMWANELIKEFLGEHSEYAVTPKRVR
jgi:hypothetical protein